MMYVVLIDEIRSGVKTNLEVWRQNLGAQRVQMTKYKTEYLERKFSEVMNETDVEVRLETHTNHPKEIKFLVF